MPCRVSASSPTSAAANKQGEFVLQYSIDITTPFLSSGHIGCQAFIQLIDGNPTSPGYGSPYGEDDASSEAVIIGNYATCTVYVPYSWAVQNSTDYVVLNAGVVAGPSLVQPTNLAVCNSTNGPGCVTAFPGRIALKDLGAFAIPANGTSTVKSVVFHI